MDRFTDTKPQVYLDQYHSVNIPRLYVPQVGPQQRKNLIALTKQKLEEIQVSLRKQIQSIQKRYNPKTEAQEAKIAVAPYDLLLKLGDQLTEAVNELETLVQGGRRLPPAVTFGSVIFGDAAKGDWHIGTDEDAALYDEMKSKESRLKQLMRDRAPLQKQIKVVNGKIARAQRETQEVTEMYKRLKPTGYLVKRLLFLFLLMVIMGVLAYLAYTQSRLALTAGAVGLALIFFLLMIRVFVNRRRKLENLRQAIQLGRTEVKRFKKEQLRVRNTYLPLNDLCKQLHREVTILRESFE